MEKGNVVESLATYEQSIQSAFDYLAHAWDEEDGQGNWEAVDKFEGEVKVSKKMEDGIYTVRGLATLKIPAKTAFKVGSGMDYWPVIDPYCVEGRQIQFINESNEVLYSRYDTGVPFVSQREFVFLESRKEEDGKYLIVDFSLDDKITNVVPPHPDSVRGTLLKGGLRITPIDDDSCEVGFIVAIHPRGWIPLWVVNALIGDEPLVLRRLEDWAIKNCYSTSDAVLVF